MATWTDERLELLTKLWKEGLTASQIAKQLGDGISRNAVIGKVHRLKLARRTTTGRSTVSRTPKAPRTNPRIARAKRKKKQLASPCNDNHPHSCDHGNHKSNLVELPGFRVINELVIPPEERATIATLEPHSCRWPIGDPTDEEFHFCGRQKKDGLPYCDFHARIAYQPLQSKRQRKSAEKRAKIQIAG